MCVWLVIGAAQAFEPAAAVLRSSDRTSVGASELAVSADGGRVLVWGEERATLLGVDGSASVVVKFTSISSGDAATTGHFALAHAGGVTVHGETGQEQVRLAAFGRVHDVAISPDGRRVAIATELAVTVHDSIDGRSLWVNEGESTDVAYDLNGGLWVTRSAGVTGYNGATGKLIGPGAMPNSQRSEDGCIPASAGPLCPVPGAVGAIFEDHILLLNGGAVELWRLLDSDQISSFDMSGSIVSDLVWMPNADLLVASEDGKIERRSPDGSVLAMVNAPNCLSPCALMGIGAAPEGGFWAVSSDGSWLEWDALGTARGKVKTAKLIGVARASDGRWVSLDVSGRVRLGKAPGKGPVLGTVAAGEQGGVAIAGENIAVWNAMGLVLMDTDGERLSPAIGAGRLPVAVALSLDGAYVAMIDNGGALHVYRVRDGGTVFRLAAGIEGTVLAFDVAGSTVFAGGTPLRAFGLKGAESGRVVFAPGGAISAFTVSPTGGWAVSQVNDRARKLLLLDVQGVLPGNIDTLPEPAAQPAP